MVVCPIWMAVILCLARSSKDWMWLIASNRLLWITTMVTVRWRMWLFSGLLFASDMLRL